MVCEIVFFFIIIELQRICVILQFNNLLMVN